LIRIGGRNPVDIHYQTHYNDVPCPGEKFLLGYDYVTPTFPIPGGDTRAWLVK